VFAGLRISELLELRWQDVDMNDARLIVRCGKTPAAAREIRMLPALVEELGLLRATVPGSRQQRVFAGHRGGAPTAENLRCRVLRPACERANQRLDEAEGSHLPEPVTHHSLRRTFASVLFAVGWTLPEVMEALGYIDARLTLMIYARSVRREPEEVAALRRLLSIASPCVRRRGSRWS
jgi:integrase